MRRAVFYPGYRKVSFIDEGYGKRRGEIYECGTCGQEAKGTDYRNHCYGGSDGRGDWVVVLEDPIPLPFLCLIIAFPVAVIGGVILALKQRIKEIDGGEEDAASKY